LDLRLWTSDLDLSLQLATGVFHILFAFYEIRLCLTPES
jgi:hypothetical protein